MPVTVRLFAALREHAGAERLNVDHQPGETVESLLARVIPDSRDWSVSLLFAVNRRYVPRDHVVEDCDEVAFVPPLGGGAPTLRASLSSEALHLQPLVDRVAGPGRGGISTFSGLVRDHFDGRPVVHLDYEAYEEMALEEMLRLCDEIEERWPGCAVAMAHRLGRLTIGEVAVLVVVAAPHRKEAFEACRFGIDELKARVPIFKKEVYEDGSTWKEDHVG